MARKATTEAAAAIEGRDCVVEVIQSNPGGRPMKFPDPVDFARRVDAYFDWCDSQVVLSKDDKGREKIIRKPYTVSGLCLYLDTEKSTLWDYQSKDGYSDTIKKAKNRIENFVEEHSLDGSLNPVVSIFNLKNNFGWTDRVEQVITTANSLPSSDAEMEQKLLTFMQKYLPKKS